MQLLIMAAGMGSRYGGLKQIEPMGPNEEFIIDYSVYDAIKAGFTKIVFIIKEENYSVFKETIGKRVEPHIPVEYVFQTMEEIPLGVSIPENREKPWGTAQAIYCARNAITDKFVVINADDFYGYDAYVKAVEFLKTSTPKEYATIGYRVKNTMTENGSVKRGILYETNGILDEIIESSIVEENGKIVATPLNGKEPFEIQKETLVSMNMLAFDLSIFEYIEKRMPEYFEENKANLENCEFLIPDVLGTANTEKFAKVKVIETRAEWYGITYKEDKEYVKKSIHRLINEEKYPVNLWW